jgi:hypothetical protein
MLLPGPRVRPQHDCAAAHHHVAPIVCCVPELDVQERGSPAVPARHLVQAAKVRNTIWKHQPVPDIRYQIPPGRKDGADKSRCVQALCIFLFAHAGLS